MSKLPHWKNIADKESIDDYVNEILRDWEEELEEANKKIHSLTIQLMRTVGDSDAKSMAYVDQLATVRQSRKRVVCIARKNRETAITIVDMVNKYGRQIDDIHKQLLIAESFNPTDQSIQEALAIIGGE